VLEEPRAGISPAARIQGQLDGLGQVIGPVAPDLLVRLDSGNQTRVTEEAVAAILPQLTNLHRIAVLPFNEDAAVGALLAARRLGREGDLVIVGQGAGHLVRTELERQGSRIMGATSYHPDRYGEALIRLALKILRGEPAPPAVNIEHSFIYAGMQAATPEPVSAPPA
jgi:ribose transport system substrate-binding protein